MRLKSKEKNTRSLGGFTEIRTRVPRLTIVRAYPSAYYAQKRFLGQKVWFMYVRLRTWHLFRNRSECKKMHFPSLSRHEARTAEAAPRRAGRGKACYVKETARRVVDLSSSNLEDCLTLGLNRGSRSLIRQGKLIFTRVYNNNSAQQQGQSNDKKKWQDVELQHTNK